MPGHQPPHQHGLQRYTAMISSVPAIDMAPFGTYPSCLAARLNGPKTVRGLSQFEAYGKYAEFIVGDCGEGESVKIGPIGNALK